LSPRCGGRLQNKIKARDVVAALAVINEPSLAERKGMTTGPKGVTEAHPTVSGLAFARRPMAEDYRLRAMAIDDAPPGLDLLQDRPGIGSAWRQPCE
jgi:hypothetical protein